MRVQGRVTRKARKLVPVHMPHSYALQELNALGPRVPVGGEARLQIYSVAAPDVVQDKLSLYKVEIAFVLPDFVKAKIYRWVSTE